MKIKKFAQSETKYENSYPIKNQKYNYWYETIEGERIKCNHPVIQKLWSKWIISKKPKKETENNFVVFIFNKAIEAQLVTY